MRGSGLVFSVATGLLPDVARHLAEVPAQLAAKQLTLLGGEGEGGRGGLGVHEHSFARNGGVGQGSRGLLSTGAEEQRLRGMTSHRRRFL